MESPVAKATYVKTQNIWKVYWMRADLRWHAYASQLKKQITIRLDEDAIAYFKAISEEVGIPYQSLISLYLRDCAASNRKLDLNWKQALVTEHSHPSATTASTSSP